MINKALVLLLTLTLSASLYGKSLFVKAGSNGDGTSWTKAWGGLSAINWGSVTSGDTIYIAGGAYPGNCQIQKSGVNLFRVKASDKAATDAAGWQASFDSTVTINVAKGTAGIYTTGSTGDSLTIDGRQDGGILIQTSDASSGIEFSGQAPKNVTLRFIKVNGPGKITQTSDVRGMDLTPSSGPMTGLKIQNCEIGGGGDSGMYLLFADGAMIEGCSFHDADAVNAAQYHQNLIYCGTIKNSTFRQNRFYNIQVEGLFFGDSGNQNLNIYANLFYQGSVPKNSGRALEFDNASTGNTNIQVINNSFVDLPLGARLDTAQYSNCKFANNIAWRTPASLGSGWSNVTNYTGSADPFKNSAAFDYSLSDNSPAKGKGTDLGSPFDVSFTGDTRSAPWDQGAYKSGSSGPVPTPSASPTPSATPSPTAAPTATPTPAPAAKFKVGDSVVTTVETNVRSTPAGTKLGAQPSGEPGTIQAGPQDAALNGENVVWYQVVFASLPNGWCGDDNLEKAMAPSPTPTPSASPSPTPSPTPPPSGQTWEKWIEKQNDWIRANPPTPDR
jgi:hypothetical protein